MGKRKREYDDREDFEYIVNKLKKLERKLKHGRRRCRHESDDSDWSVHSEEGQQPLESNPSTAEDEIIDVHTLRSVVNVPVPSTSSAAQPVQPGPLTPPAPSLPSAPIAPIAPLAPIAPIAPPAAIAPIAPTAPLASPAPLAPPAPLAASTPPPPPPLTTAPPSGAEAENADDPLSVPELDGAILEILGDDPLAVKQYGKEIQTDLAVRLQHIATTGLSKETRKDLCDKYLPPSNCTLIDAPELNAELKAAVSDAVIKRDKAIELKQQQVGRAITCISEALTTLISKDEKDTAVIKLLMDTSRLLCDNQNLDSVTRRNFVLFNLKKEMKDQIQKTKIDRLLFGADLTETLKTAKSITRSGADLKPVAPPNKPTASKNKAAPQQTATPPPRNNLNWRAPPLNRRPQGNQRTRGSAPRNQHASSSRTSYRAPHQRYNSRR